MESEWAQMARHQEMVNQQLLNQQKEEKGRVKRDLRYLFPLILTPSNQLSTMVQQRETQKMREIENKRQDYEVSEATRLQFLQVSPFTLFHFLGTWQS